jgi:hypothetical protein
MQNKRKHKQLSPRRQRRARRNHAIAAGKQAAPGFRHLNWFDANIAAFLMERGGRMPAASQLIFQKHQPARESEQAVESI